MGVSTMRVPTIFTAVDRFSSVVSKMTRKTALFGETAAGAAMRTSKKFNDAGTKMLATGAVMAVGIGYAASKAMHFEDQMGKINTVLHLTPDKMRIVSKEVRNMAKHSVNSFDDITDSFYELSSAGVKLPDIFKMIGSGEKLSIGGIGSMSDATELILSKQRNFWKENLTAEEAANQAQKIMKYGKGTLADLSPSYTMGATPFGLAGGKSAQYDAMIAGLTATKQSQATSISQIGLATTSAMKGRGNFKPIYKQLGIKGFAELVDKNSGDVLKSFQQIVDKGQEIGVNINQIFGRAGASTGITLLLKNQAVINQYTAAYNDLLNKTNNELDKAYKERSDNSAAQWKRLTNQLTDLSITVGNAVLPALGSIIDKITPILESISNWGQKNEWLAKTLLYTTGLLLGLGAAFKITAAIFYGWGMILKTITFIQAAYTTVTELCTVATYLAAGGQATFAASLWAVAAGLLAAYWPVLLVVGAIGALVYAFSDSEDATTSFVNTQLAGLDKSNMAWKDSTGVVKGELDKQAALMNKTTAKKPLVFPKDIYEKSTPKSASQKILDTYINKTVSQQQIDNMVYSERENAISSGGYMPIYESTKNLAGVSRDAISTNSPNSNDRIGGVLKIEVDQTGAVINVNPYGITGIKPVVTSTKH